MIIYLFFLPFPWPAHGPHIFFFPAPISQLLRTSIAKLKGCVEVNSLVRVIPLQFYHTFSYTYPMINLEQLSFVSLFQLKYERDGIFRFHDNLFSFSTNQPPLRNKSFIVRLDITRLPPRTQQVIGEQSFPLHQHCTGDLQKMVVLLELSTKEVFFIPHILTRLQKRSAHQSFPLQHTCTHKVILLVSVARERGGSFCTYPPALGFPVPSSTTIFLFSVHPKLAPEHGNLPMQYPLSVTGTRTAAQHAQPKQETCQCRSSHCSWTAKNCTFETSNLPAQIELPCTPSHLSKHAACQRMLIVFRA